MFLLPPLAPATFSLRNNRWPTLVRTLRSAEAQRKDISACLARQEGTATLSWSSLTVTVTDVKVRGGETAGSSTAVLTTHQMHLSPCLHASTLPPLCPVQGNERQILKGVDGYIEPNHMLVSGSCATALWCGTKEETLVACATCKPSRSMLAPLLPLRRPSWALPAAARPRCLVRGKGGCRLQAGNPAAVNSRVGSGPATPDLHTHDPLPLPCFPTDTLAGRLAKSARSTGDIRVNGHKSKLSFGRSAYVTQDDVRGLLWLAGRGDLVALCCMRTRVPPRCSGLKEPAMSPCLQVLIGTLTVYETIMYSAKLRLPQVGTGRLAVVACAARLAMLACLAPSARQLGSTQLPHLKPNTSYCAVAPPDSACRVRRRSAL